MPKEREHAFSFGLRGKNEMILLSLTFAMALALSPSFSAVTVATSFIAHVVTLASFKFIGNWYKHSRVNTLVCAAMFVASVVAWVTTGAAPLNLVALAVFVGVELNEGSKRREFSNFSEVYKASILSEKGSAGVNELKEYAVDVHSRQPSEKLLFAAKLGSRVTETCSVPGMVAINNYHVGDDDVTLVLSGSEAFLVTTDEGAVQSVSNSVNQQKKMLDQLSGRNFKVRAMPVLPANGEKGIDDAMSIIAQSSDADCLVPDVAVMKMVVENSGRRVR